MIEISISGWAISIHIDGINLVFSPKLGNSEENDLSREYQRWLKKKQRQIKHLEQILFQNDESTTPISSNNSPSDEQFLEEHSDEIDSMSWLQRLLLVTAIKNSLISITNVHVRFEDHYTSKTVMTYAAGFTVQEIEVKTSENEFDNVEIGKIIKVSGVYGYLDLVYNNPNNWYISSSSNSDLYKRMTTEAKFPNRTRHSYFIENMDVSMVAVFNSKSGENISKPVVDVLVKIDQFRANLTMEQCQAVVDISNDVCRNNFVVKRHWDLRPKGKFEAKQWWSYAIKVVLRQIRGPPTSAEFIKHRIWLCRNYRRHCLNKLTGNGDEELTDTLMRDIEDYLDPVCIVIHRYLATKSYQHLMAKVRKEEEEETEEPQTLWSMVTGYFDWFTLPDFQNSEIDETLTAADRNEILDQLGDFNDIFAKLSSDEFVKYRFGFMCGESSFNLFNDSKTSVCQSIVSSLGFSLETKREGFKIEAKFGDFEVTGVDGTKIVETWFQEHGQQCNALTINFQSEIYNTSKANLNICCQPIGFIYHTPTVHLLTNTLKGMEAKS